MRHEKNDPTKSLPLSEWPSLSERDLKLEVSKRIIYWETPNHYFIEPYQQIEHSNLKDKVDKILLDLIGQFNDGVGEKALYVCVHFRLRGLSEKILALLPQAEALYSDIKKNPVKEEWGIQIQYLLEFNSAVKALGLKEGRDFLVKQLNPLKAAPPQPATKEFYLYQLAQFASDALKKIDLEY